MSVREVFARVVAAMKRKPQCTEYPDGTKEWIRDGVRHREDGPAVIMADGTKYWIREGDWHREDGPAIEYPNGERMWYRKNKLHREDGPAIEFPDGTKHWYRNGIELTNDEVATMVTKSLLTKLKMLASKAPHPKL